MAQEPGLPARAPFTGSEPLDKTRDALSPSLLLYEMESLCVTQEREGPWSTRRMELGKPIPLHSWHMQNRLLREVALAICAFAPSEST